MTAQGSGTPTRQQVQGRRLLGLMTQSVGAKVLTQALRIVRNIVLARVLGPYDRGLLALVMTVPELLSTAVNLGSTATAAYHGSQRDAVLPVIFGYLLLFCLGFGAVVGMVSAIALSAGVGADLFDDDAVRYVAIIGTMVPVFLFKNALQGLLLARDRVGTANALRVLESGGPLVLFLVLWATTTNLLDAAVVAWAVALISVCLGAAGSLVYEGIWPPKVHAPTFRRLLSYGSRGHFDGMFQAVLFRIDFIFVGAMLGAQSLGHYAMATAAAELLLTFSEAVVYPLMSRLLRSHERPDDRLIPLVLRSVWTLMCVAAIVMALLGDALIELLFGSAYLPGYLPLLWLLPGLVALSLCGIFRLYLLGRNRPGVASAVGGLAAVANVVLNLIFIPAWGLSGAALASSLAYVFVAVGLHLQYSRMSGVGPSETLVPRLSDFRQVLALLRPR
ncbi:MAG: oligosaccharide flippase family protein [Pseudomonadota bacterium]|nr:oligosaccharide flippase family protein [Pseudomonadota bacterium]